MHKEINSEDVHIDECKESTAYEVMKVLATLENPKTQRQIITSREGIIKATDLHNRAEKSQDAKISVIRAKNSTGLLGSIDKVKRCRSFVSTNQSTPESPKT
jgi:hypothetical protein